MAVPPQVNETLFLIAAIEKNILPVIDLRW